MIDHGFWRDLGFLAFSASKCSQVARDTAKDDLIRPERLPRAPRCPERVPRRPREGSKTA
eukprot:8328214-Pyramimonas_sp.AAC.1